MKNVINFRPRGRGRTPLYKTEKDDVLKTCEQNEELRKKDQLENIEAVNHLRVIYHYESKIAHIRYGLSFVLITLIWVLFLNASYSFSNKTYPIFVFNVISLVLCIGTLVSKLFR